jgi:hypothetical protein
MTDPDRRPGPATTPSSFVTVVAWILILLCALTALVGLIQSIMLRFLPLDQLDSALRDSTVATTMPATARAVFGHFQLLAGGVVVLSLLMLGAAVGLLRRRNWARLVFIGALAIATVCMIAGVFVQQAMISSVGTSFGAVAGPDATLAHTSQQVAGVLKAMRIMTTVFALGFAALFAWIIVRLVSPEMRAEFD